MRINWIVRKQSEQILVGKRKDNTNEEQRKKES